MSILLSTLLAAMFAILIMFAEHYLPWRYVVSHDRLHPVANYILGLLGIFLPYTALMAYWRVTFVLISPLAAAAALWAIAAAAGITVSSLYILDSWYQRGVCAREAEERESQLSRQMDL